MQDTNQITTRWHAQAKTRCTLTSRCSLQYCSSEVKILFFRAARASLISATAHCLAQIVRQSWGRRCCDGYHAPAAEHQSFDKPVCARLGQLDHTVARFQQTNRALSLGSQPCLHHQRRPLSVPILRQISQSVRLAHLLVCTFE